MSNWDRIALLNLADAIRDTIAEASTSAPQKQRMVPILAEAKAGAQFVQTSGEDLDNLRSQMCNICRDEALYICDKNTGWSPNCALLHKSPSA